MNFDQYRTRILDICDEIVYIYLFIYIIIITIIII